MANLSRKQSCFRRHRRLRKKIVGSASIPRLSVCVTGKHFYVQFIDDDSGHTLVSLSTLDPKLRSENIHANCKGAEALGKVVAEKALEAGINKVVFDRGGFKFHGRVKKLAEVVRAAGLEF